MLNSASANYFSPARPSRFRTKKGLDRKEPNDPRVQCRRHGNRFPLHRPRGGFLSDRIVEIEKTALSNLQSGKSLDRIITNALASMSDACRDAAPPLRRGQQILSLSAEVLLGTIFLMHIGVQLPPVRNDYRAEGHTEITADRFSVVISGGIHSNLCMALLACYQKARLSGHTTPLACHALALDCPNSICTFDKSGQCYSPSSSTLIAS